jgi:hypothetical protein
MVATHRLAIDMLRHAGITPMRLRLQDAGNLAIELLRMYRLRSHGHLIVPQGLRPAGTLLNT